MSKTTKARKHQSAALQTLLDEVTPIEMEQTKVKMLIAARIEDFMIAKDMSKTQFAQQVGRNPSEVTKWLSGNQNFTIETLIEIAAALDIEVTQLLEYKPRVELVHAEIMVKASYKQPAIVITTPLNQKSAVYGIYMFHGKGPISKQLKNQKV